MQPVFIDHILVLVLGLVLPFFSGIRGSEKLGSIYFSEAVRRRFYLSNSLVLWVMSLVVMGIWAWNGRPFDLMGFSTPHPGWVAPVLAAALGVLYIADILYSLLSPEALRKTHEQWESGVPFLPERARELPAYVLMCISAGFCEELMYRGFLVTYFIDPMKPGFPWLAAIFPAILFSMAHFYQGYKAMFKIMLLSALFALIFIFSGSLLYVVIIHFLIDLVGGLIAMYARRTR